MFVKTTTENKRARTKVIAIGDVHGDEDVLRRLLFATGATDKVLGEDVKWVKERNERERLSCKRRRGRSREGFDWEFYVYQRYQSAGFSTRR